MTPALDRLESAGLVRRKSHRVDRRRTEIRLTKAGARQAKQIFRAEIGFMHSLLEEFSDRDRKTLTSVVDRLVARLDAFQPGSRVPSSKSVT
ncbi:MAG: hypothetical protein P8R42_16300 [Candidatus Binatia bacterium]|nr:hypothetical protein [Candidatus Binatia bacterium]